MIIRNSELPDFLLGHRLPKGTSLYCNSGAVLTLLKDAGPGQPLRFLIKDVQKSASVHEIAYVKLPKGSTPEVVKDLYLSSIPEFELASDDFYLRVFFDAPSFFEGVTDPAHCASVEELVSRGSDSKVSKVSSSSIATSGDVSEVSSDEVQPGFNFDLDAETDDESAPNSFSQELALSLVELCKHLTGNSSELIGLYRGCMQDEVFLEAFSKADKGFISEHPLLTKWFDLDPGIRSSLKTVVWCDMMGALYSSEDSKDLPMDEVGDLFSQPELVVPKSYRGVCEFRTANFEGKDDSPLNRAKSLSDQEKARLYDQMLSALLAVSDSSCKEGGDLSPYVGFELTDNVGWLRLLRSDPKKPLQIEDGFRSEPTVLVRGSLRVPLTELLD